MTGKIDMRLARTLTLDEITAGCVKELGVTVGELLSRDGRYNRHRAIWYAVLDRLSGRGKGEIAKYVRRDRTRLHATMKDMTGYQRRKTMQIVAILQRADFDG